MVEGPGLKCVSPASGVEKTRDVSGPGRTGLSVLRICSVFEPPAGLALAHVARFDPIGGMQNHAAGDGPSAGSGGVRGVASWPRG